MVEFGALGGRTNGRDGASRESRTVDHRGRRVRLWLQLVVPGPFLVIFGSARRWREIANGRHLLVVLGSVSRLGRGLREAGHGEHVVSSCTVLIRRGRLGEELLKVFEKIGSCVEEASDLGVDFLYRFRLALVRLKDLEELFVDFGLVLVTVLCGRMS